MIRGLAQGALAGALARHIIHHAHTDFDCKYRNSHRNPAQTGELSTANMERVQSGQVGLLWACGLACFRSVLFLTPSGPETPIHIANVATYCIGFISASYT